MRTKIARIAVALALGSASAAACADVYRYVDERGNVIYSNVPPGGFQESDERAEAGRNRLETSRAGPAARAGRANVNSSSDFPKVSASTQRDRDSLRRRILEDELRDEQALYRQSVAKGASDDADAHQRNIRSLEKELAYSSR